LTAGDRIVALNGRIVTSVDDLHRLLTGLVQEGAAVVTRVRGREKREVTVRLGVLR
jgi:S1-C subfamily serine protease